MRGIFQDIRFSLRQFRKSPGFAAVAVVTLALGIGANTAIFSVVNGVLLRPLAFKDAGRLVRVWHVPPAKSFPGMPTFSVSAANYLDWERQNQVFEGMAIYSFRGFILTGSDKPEQVDACSASSGFFSTLGIQPMLGRVFTPEEDQAGRSNVVVLSHRLWQERFGGNRDIVGHNINLDGQSYLVAGVMPVSFQFPDFAQMWTPMAWTDKERAVRGEHHSVVVARLKPGVDLKQAQAAMNTISSRLEQQYPEDNKGWGAVVVPLHDDLVSDVRPALLVLLGAVAFVLLIASVNVANLALARTFGRQKEIAIRTALGASSARILRQVITESVLLALAGGALGLTYAHAGVRLIMAFLADKLSHSVEVKLDAKVLAFTAIISVVAGILAGVLPALRLSRGNVSQSLKQGLGRTDADSSGHGTRSILVVLEVALSLMLLVGAGLMIRSFQRLHAVNPGFDSHNVLTMSAMVSRAKFPEPSQQAGFFRQVLQRVRRLPGVESAGVIDDVPLDNGGSHQPVAIEGRPILPMSEQPEVDVRLSTPGYMSALRIPILRGRDFSDTDLAGRPTVVLISESMARQFWPNEDALGKRLTLTFFPDAVREVVGVVGDVKMDGLDQTRPSPTLYFPLEQISAPANGGWKSFPMTLVVRSASGSAGMATAVSNAVHDVDREMPLRDILNMDDLVANSLSQQRFNMLLLGAFAGLALLLAGGGIYSVLSYSVRRRVREIGIRLALGARVGDVLRMVVVEGLKPALLGMAIGAAGALALGRVLSSLIYEVKPADPITFFAVTGLLAAIALFASVIPAYRATKVDPMTALRYE
ncbi:MAG: efflux pump, inner rane subunit [Candidatus Sulfotelmatobacter sp.]|nr:efflux pump, inner rane subunit [Candidatus Sulfotelmatobacter sp.]